MYMTHVVKILPGQRQGPACIALFLMAWRRGSYMIWYYVKVTRLMGQCQHCATWIPYYMKRIGDNLLYIAWYSWKLPYGYVDPFVTGRCDYSEDGEKIWHSVSIYSLWIIQERCLGPLLKLIKQIMQHVRYPKWSTEAAILKCTTSELSRCMKIRAW